MVTPTEHTHHIKIRSTQMEIPSSGSSSRGAEDYDRKLQDAQAELERIGQEREELERKKLERPVCGWSSTPALTSHPRCAVVAGGS